MFVAVAQAYGQGLQADEQQPIIRGTVINAVTQAPIPRALVYSADNRFAKLTDGDGRFEFVLPAASDSGTVFGFAGQPHQLWPVESAGIQLWLMARKPGFLDDPNERSEAHASSGDDITISLMPEAVIKGRVTLSSSDLADGVSVQLYTRQVMDGMPRWMPGPSVRANSSGEFRFAELRPGSYKVVTHEWMDNDPVASIPGSQMYGFPPVYYPGVADLSAASAIELAAGQTFQADLSLTRQPYFAVKIPVASGESAGGINVSVQGQRGPGYSLGYNAGKQTIEGALPNGNYVVEARRYGADSSTGSVNLRVADAPAEGPTITFTENSLISLDVKEEFNETAKNSGSWSDGKHTYVFHGPRTYLNVWLEREDDFAPPRGGTIRPPRGPNDDLLVLENVSPGRYWLRLSTSRGYVASATMGVVDLLHQPLVVGSGPGAPIEIKMRDDVAEIDGTVTDVASSAGVAAGNATASSSPRAWVYCVPLPDSPGQFQHLAVSGEGRFDSSTMAPGDYRVLAFANRQPNLPYRDAEAMRAYETKGQVIHLAPGQKATVQVQIISSIQ